MTVQDQMYDNKGKLYNVNGRLNVVEFENPTFDHLLAAQVSNQGRIALFAHVVGPKVEYKVLQNEKLLYAGNSSVTAAHVYNSFL